MNRRLAGQVAIVTGAASGIGAAIATRFAREGASVVVADINTAGADEVAEGIRHSGATSTSVHVDVGDDSSVDAMVSLVERDLGPVDVLVNNAMSCLGDGLVDMDRSVWDQDVRVVLGGTFACSRRVLRTMVERRSGAIVNIASVNGLSYLGNEAYSAAKAGVINLTQSIAVRYGRYGIRANAVVPGSIRTPAWEQRVERDPGIHDRISRWYPLGRVGEPEDVANAVVFLSSEESSWITGTSLLVDGGLLAGNAVMTSEMMVERGSADR